MGTLERNSLVYGSLANYGKRFEHVFDFLFDVESEYACGAIILAPHSEKRVDVTPLLNSPLILE